MVSQAVDGFHGHRPMTPRSPDRSAIWLLPEEARDSLDEVESVMREAVTSDDQLLSSLALHLMSLGGKRLRPALLLLASGASPYPEPVLRAAAVVELIHLASLYHDDVMDRAVRRRGGESANRRWGNELAVLAGSHLFSRAASLLASMGDEAVRLGGEAAVRLCRGQLREAESAYNLDLTVSEHLGILELKTAALFELAVRLGALLGARSPSVMGGLPLYAQHLGIAFQLADDVLDFTGDAATIGKNVGNDLQEGVYSLPVLLTLRRSDHLGLESNRILGQLELRPIDIERVFELVAEADTVSETVNLARRHAEKAVEALHVLDPGTVRASLEGLARFAVERSA